MSKQSYLANVVLHIFAYECLAVWLEGGGCKLKIDCLCAIALYLYYMTVNSVFGISNCLLSVSYHCEVVRVHLKMRPTESV